MIRLHAMSLRGLIVQMNSQIDSLGSDTRPSNYRTWCATQNRETILVKRLHLLSDIRSLPNPVTAPAAQVLLTDCWSHF
jgi:hypothetical protein